MPFIDSDQHTKSSEYLCYNAPPPCRGGPSPWLALWYGMVSHWLSGHFL